MRGERPHNPNADYVIEDGIYFYKESSSGYYLGNVAISGRKRRYPMRLHVYVWQKYNGEVPKGYHVHHKDENKDNNDISNLELLKAYDHLSHHASSETHIEFSRRNMNEIVRPAAIAWHKSEASKGFHETHYQNVTKEIWMAPVTKTCEVCGKEYTTTHAKAKTSKYCSNNCKATARRQRGDDKIPFTCSICGKTYMKFKYSKAQCCSDCNRIRLAESRRQMKARRLASSHPELKTDGQQ